jgi:chromosome partitioning protein
VKIIAITGCRGGTGKTTTALHLATFFSSRGTTILMDGTRDKRATEWGNLAPEGNLPFKIISEHPRRLFPGNTQFVVLDTLLPPSTDSFIDFGRGCDLVIVPTTSDALEWDQSLKDLQHFPSDKLRILLMQTSSTLIEPAKLPLHDFPRACFLDTTIKRTTAFQRAISAGKSVRDLEEKSAATAWSNFCSFGQEVERLLEVTF